MECGGEAIRVHIGSFDITKAKDVSRLIAIIEDNPGCDLWASIPCGPWSTWQYVNLSLHGAEFASHLNDLRRSSQVMFAAFARACRAVRRGGGRVAFEWPRHCLGWKQPFMQRFLADPDVETVDFDGCDFGMQDKDGVPIRKQWKVATTSKELIDELSGRKCKHEKGYLRARIEGSVTPTTALYPSAMCEAIVGAWYPNGTFKKVASAMPVEVDPVEQRWKKKPNTLYVSLVSENAKIATRATSGSAGLDTYASEGVCIPAGGSGLVSAGISIEMPAGVYARIAPRSGLAVKNRIAVGGGVIDPDYDGEVKVILFNHGDEDFIVRPGDRIAQIVLERVMLIDASIVPRKTRRGTDRGSAGFGSTGIAAATPTIGSDGKTFEFSMPRKEISPSHRPKDSGAFPPVARPVNKKEQAGNAKAKAALQKEGDTGLVDCPRMA